MDIISRSDSKVAAIPKDTVKALHSHDILAINFLYQKCQNKFVGAVLNEDDEMNMQLQVSAFCNVVFNYVEQKFLVLIVCPERLLLNWHYHLATHGKLQIHIVTPKSCPEDFDQEHGMALLLSFSNLNLVDSLLDYEFSSVIIDEFDHVANKTSIRKLKGDFNIGLTSRNFYFHPNQKLQWTMLNWCNPGCVGKLMDFYEVDNDNFANLSDNYNHWWLRLTWNFCESFKKPSDEENESYRKKLAIWAKSNNLEASDTAIVTKRKRASKRKYEVKTEEDNKPKQQAKRNLRHAANKNETVSENIDSKEILQLPVKQENPILNSIVTDLDRTSESNGEIHSSADTIIASPERDKANEIHSSADTIIASPGRDKEDDVLLSIIDSAHHAPIDHEAQVLYKKEELLFQMFGDSPCASRNISEPDDSDFLSSFID